MTQSKIWQSKKSVPLDATIEKFTVGPDLDMDARLVKYDVIASTAHAAMLSKMGHLKKLEFSKLKKELKTILDKVEADKFSLKGQEDMHSAIEAELIKKLGKLGGKIHLGRSRNDQSAVAIRLFAKKEVLEIQAELLAVIETLLKLAKKWSKIPMPGYTHVRPAMPSSVGLYFGAFAEALNDDYQSIKSVLETFDSCPLGASAGYGSTVPVDRKLTAKLLGFARVQNNSLSTQIARGQMETAILGALTNFSVTTSRLSNDLIYFSSSAYDFFVLGDNVSTGSSIMPQKRNPDPLEILRGTPGLLLGFHTQVATISKGLPSGYQRDLQLTKKPLVEGIKLAKHALQALNVVLKNISINKKQLIEAASDPQLYAAEMANDLVMKDGLSFREAYKKVKDVYLSGEKLAPRNPQTTIQKSKSLGMSGNLNLKPTQDLLSREKRSLNIVRKKFAGFLQKIWQI